MTDTSRAPDRIWLWQDGDSRCVSTPIEPYPSDATKYIREDISQAREAAAYEVAAQQLTPLLSFALAAKDAAYTESYHAAMAVRADGLELGIRRIRALTPADAKAALDRLIAEAVQADRELQRKWEEGR